MDPAEVDQVTAVFDEPLTVAVNCCVALEETEALVGVIVTETWPGAAIWKTWLADPLQVFCSIPDPVPDPARSIQPFDKFPDKML